MSEMDKKTKGHIETLNREMGVVQTKVEYLEETCNRIENRIDKIDKRVWWILGGVVVGILMNILIALY